MIPFPKVKSHRLRLRSLEIEKNLDLGGLLNWEVGGFLALENAAGIDAGQAVGIGDAAAVAREAACGNEVATLIDRGHFMMNSELAKSAATAVEECIAGAEHEAADAQLSCAYKGKLEFAVAAGI